jgi:hypothetical protein
MKNEQKKLKTNEAGVTYFSQYVNEFGEPVKRDKWQYPYSYDGFITWRGGKNEEVNSTIYSDRLLQWDMKKYDELSKKHFGNAGQIFYDRQPKDIESFLRDWTGDIKLKLIFVMEYCNVSSGFPLWRFDYRTSVGG